MSIKSFSAKLFAKYIAGKTQKWSANPVATQDAVFQYLIKKGAKAKFGIRGPIHGIRTRA